MIKQPMLAGSLKDSSKLRFPVMASPKLDGIRCLKLNGKALSRKFKSIPNTFIREWIENNLPDGIDGELIVPGASFNQIQGDVMREEGQPNFEFHGFDIVINDVSEPFMTRYHELVNYYTNMPSDKFKLVEHKIITSAQELDAYEAECLQAGYEGVMVRSTNGPYKNGRSTEKEGYLLKVKRFEDSEAKVIGFMEQNTNNNEAEEDELGHTKRSSHKENMVPNGHLGKFIVIEIGDKPWKDKEFFIGGAKGMTMAMRKDIWENRDKYLGKIVKYTYQPHGVKDLPRLPIWIGFRDERDMS